MSETDSLTSSVSLTSEESDHEIEPYDMNVLEEYMSLFGNPFQQNVKDVLKNVESLCWPKEEILNLFDEMLDETYANFREQTEVSEIDRMSNYILSVENEMKNMKISK
jgi:hypothetical protein